MHALFEQNFIRNGGASRRSRPTEKSFLRLQYLSFTRLIPLCLSCFLKPLQWVPAFAGMTSLRRRIENFDVMVLNGSEEVIPAKAGTHFQGAKLEHHFLQPPGILFIAIMPQTIYDHASKIDMVTQRRIP